MLPVTEEMRQHRIRDCGNVIAPGRSQIHDRGDDRNFSGRLERFEFVIDDIRRRHRAARRINPEDDGFHLVILGGLRQLFLDLRNEAGRGHDAFFFLRTDHAGDIDQQYLRSPRTADLCFFERPLAWKQRKIERTA